MMALKTTFFYRCRSVAITAGVGWLVIEGGRVVGVGCARVNLRWDPDQFIGVQHAHPVQKTLPSIATDRRVFSTAEGQSHPAQQHREKNEHQTALQLALHHATAPPDRRPLALATDGPNGLRFGTRATPTVVGVAPTTVFFDALFSRAWAGCYPSHRCSDFLHPARKHYSISTSTDSPVSSSVMVPDPSGSMSR